MGEELDLKDTEERSVPAGLFPTDNQPQKPLSPLAKSILENIRNPLARFPGRQSVSVAEIVERNRVALNALPIEERTAVMREVNAATGFGLFPEEPPKAPPNSETPSAPARFLGRREPRLSDLILALRPRNSDEAGEQDHIRKAEKFVFDGDAMEKAFSAVKRLSHEDLSLAVSELRFPFRLSWFESGWTETPHGGNGGFVRGGFLIQTDETNQRGVFMFFGESKMEGVTPVNMNIFFDFTAEWNCEPPDPKDIVEKMSGQKTPRIFQSMETRNNVGPFFARFSFLVEKYEHQHASKIMTEMLGDMEVGHQLVAFLLILAMPKDTVEITKDDFGEYNQSCRLGLHKSQHQEYHVVRVNKTTYEPTAETAAILACYRQQRDETSEREYVPRGEHKVRMHKRVYRSGRVVWVKEHKRGSGSCKTKRAGYEVDDFPMMTREQAEIWLRRRLDVPETAH
jgi:hypothetical protein